MAMAANIQRNRFAIAKTNNFFKQIKAEYNLKLDGLSHLQAHDNSRNKVCS